jgi:2-C-methyl-D-erythritol 2,4-cyclodiphosphate synthase
MVRIGVGYDSHRLVQGDTLILGGVRIESEWGLAGHSDADVLLHAVSDALLGALALGDLGQHFPDTDPRYRGISSGRLLEKVIGMVQDQGYRLYNLDVVVIAQRPRLAAYIPVIRINVANLLAADLASVSVKVKTAEGLGALGRGEGIAVHAVCLVTRIRH